MSAVDGNLASVVVVQVHMKAAVLNVETIFEGALCWCCGYFLSLSARLFYCKFQFLFHPIIVLIICDFFLLRTSRCIGLISFSLAPLKRKGDCPHALLPVANSLYKWLPAGSYRPVYDIRNRDSADDAGWIVWIS